MKHAAAFLLTLFVLPGVAAAGQNQPQASISLETVGRVVRMLEDSGYRYTKAASSVWTITFKGDNRESVQVLVSAATNQMLIIDAVVAFEDELGNNAEALRQLLRLNATVTDATLIIDRDDDCVARGWYVLKDLNSKKFKDAVQTVALAADEAYGGLAEYVSSSNAPTPSPARAPARRVSSSSSKTVVAPRGATAQVEILNGRASVWFDPSEWTQAPEKETGRITLKHTSGEGFAMVIFDRIGLPTDKLREFALTNAREFAADVRVTEEQRRVVNGTEVLMLRLDCTISGIPFTYLGYYYGSEIGNVQVVTYTSRNLFTEHRTDFEDLLNGFRVK